MCVKTYFRTIVLDIMAGRIFSQGRAAMAMRHQKEAAARPVFDGVDLAPLNTKGRPVPVAPSRGAQ